MNWVVFAIFTYIIMALQQGLAPMLDLQVGREVITPQLVLVLAVFVGLFTPRHAMLGAWFIIGLLVDLTHGGFALQASDPARGGQLTLIGPYTLGYLAGGLVIGQLRSMVYRRHPVSMGFLVVVCGLAVELVVVFIMTVRQTYDPLMSWSAWNQLAVRGLCLLYSGAIGTILAVGLIRLAPLFHFTDAKRQTPRVY